MISDEVIRRAASLFRHAALRCAPLTLLAAFPRISFYAPAATLPLVIYSRPF